MKKSAVLLLLAFVLPVFWFSAVAQEKTQGLPSYEFDETGKSLLWEITGKTLKTPSYLYGTIHIQDKRVFQYDDIVQECFDYSSACALELLLDEIDQAEAMALMLMPGDTTLKTLLTPEDFDFVAAKIKEKTGQNIFFFQKMRPLFISSQIELTGAGSEMALPLDMHLDKMAKEQGKKRIGLEKFEHQAAAVKSIPLNKQAKMLVESLRDTSAKDEKESMIEEMIAKYRAGDLEAMLDLTDSEDDLGEDFQVEFLTKRNKVMAYNIAKHANNQSTFSAVGAAHLGGEDGVIALLRAEGYTVKAIKTQFKPLDNSAEGEDPDDEEDDDN